MGRASAVLNRRVFRTAGQADDRLDQAIHAATAGGPMVVIVGPLKAGKTRTAFEALRRVLLHARLAAPLPGMLNRLAAHQCWQTSTTRSWCGSTTWIGSSPTPIR